MIPLLARRLAGPAGTVAFATCLATAAGAIDVRGYGESNPLMQTALDTREPQNRRVEIILR